MTTLLVILEALIAGPHQNGGATQRIYDLLIAIAKVMYLAHLASSYMPRLPEDGLQEPVVQKDNHDNSDHRN